MMRQAGVGLVPHGAAEQDSHGSVNIQLQLDMKAGRAVKKKKKSEAKLVVIKKILGTSL